MIKDLLATGYMANVEKSTGRVFRDEEFEAKGPKLVPDGSWVDIPKDHIIMESREISADN